MSSRHVALVLLAVALLSPAAVRAGMKTYIPVTVDTVNRQAYGNLGTARNTADVNQGIGCMVSSAGGPESLYCWAKSSAGLVVSCTSSNQYLISVAKALNGDSGAWFRYDTSGLCTSLYAYNYSSYEPKQP